jgi:hypothetical protein
MAKKRAKSSQSNASVNFSILAGQVPKVIASISLDDSENKHEKAAMRWRYKMRQRQRWSTNEELAVKMEAEAAEQLKELGITDEHLKELSGTSQAQASDASGFVHSLIEVAIPWRGEARDWWARIMPWEFIISAATKKYRARRKRVVVRRLVVSNDKTSSTTRATAPKSFAILKAAPGKISYEYDFSEEERLVASSLKSINQQDLHKDCGVDPPLETIAAWCRKTTNRPGILHITGVDTFYCAEILNIPVSAKDGLFLAGNKQPYDAVDAERFAKEMFGAYQPNLVAFNLWNSGARMAPLAIAHGAQAAIGFEDTFDDSVAERFYAQFYRLYSEYRWLTGKAFFDAIKVIGPLSQRTRGSSIILWTRDSLLVPLTAANRKVIEREVEIVEADPNTHNVRDLIRVEAVPVARLNYATLHNRGSVMNRLKIGLFPQSNKSLTNAKPKLSRAKDKAEHEVNSIRNIEVQVELCAGGEKFPYRTSLDLVPDENVVDLANTALQETENHGAGGIYVPLTSDLMRSVDESMLTSINVTVSWSKNTIYNRTFPVQLAPVDEWRFEDDQIIWMPSFVHPRDEAVGKIIDSAQRYLACLADDCNAGFGGYQAYDKDAEDPWMGVQQQVQAIWTALTLDFGLSYINPPPSYSENSQRLRTPSRVLSERRGTCVDLALLMAACLEWVEIYPVIFNLNDHAFPGYWRSSEAYEEFQSNPKITRSNEGSNEAATSQLNNHNFLPWNAPSSAYAEIRSYVLGEGDGEIPGLVPMETVFLTQRTGFSAAVAEAQEYFAQPISEDFYSMVDICRSRIQVTPIPLSAIRH